MQYNPHDYQKYVIEYIEKQPVSAVFLDMGFGKTSITLTAINNLLFDYFAVRKVLVIAPLRVAKNTWSAEINKWDHLNDLKYSIVVGTPAERNNALKADADIYIINRENIPWLTEYMGTAFDFDMVVIDELSSFKNYQAKRFKALMRVRPSVKRIVGLTGTPSSRRRLSACMVRTYLESGTVSANECKALSAGSKFGHGCYHAHCGKRYN